MRPKTRHFFHSTRSARSPTTFFLVVPLSGGLAIEKNEHMEKAHADAAFRSPDMKAPVDEPKKDRPARQRAPVRRKDRVLAPGRSRGGAAAKPAALHVPAPVASAYVNLKAMRTEQASLSVGRDDGGVVVTSSTWKNDSDDSEDEDDAWYYQPCCVG